MKIQMNEFESNKLNRMFEQHDQMFDMITELKEVIVGNDTYQRQGVIGELKELKKAVTDHDKLDAEKFDKIFEYQRKQQLFAGWTSIIVKAFWAIALMGIGHFITVVFKV